MRLWTELLAAQIMEADTSSGPKQCLIRLRTRAEGEAASEKNTVVFKLVAAMQERR